MRHQTSARLRVAAYSGAAILALAVSIGARGGQGAGAGRGAAPPQGAVPPPSRPIGTFAGPADRLMADPALADRGKVLWTAECASCHGPTARGTDRGANLVRSVVVLHDRGGNELGPFLQKGHPTQSNAPSANLSDQQVRELSHFLRQRVDDTLRGSPIFEVQDILTGDPKRGAAYFAGEGQCTTCHSATGDLAGTGTRLSPVNIQQRFIFPFSGRGRGRGRGAPAAGANRAAVTVTVTPSGGQAVSGTRVELDDFFVTLRDASGTLRTFRRTPGTVVVVENPLQFHIDLLDRITDAQMHDVVAYLETLK